MKKLRVWHNCQVGRVKDFYIGVFYVEVESIEMAWKILNTLWDYDLFQHKHRNASGLEYFCEEENDWYEWHDDLGLDVIEHFKILSHVEREQ